MTAEKKASLTGFVSLAAGLVLGVATQVAVTVNWMTPALLGFTVAMLCVIIGVQPVYAGIAPEEPPVRPISADWRPTLVIMAVATGVGTFLLSSGNRYQTAGVILWSASILCWWLAWADVHFPPLPSLSSLQVEARRPLLVAGLLVAILLLGAAFRFVDLPVNPREMGSDHAEKLLDVHDVLAGRSFIFFERNTGREPWQFYWTAMLVRVLNIPPDFMALKLGTALIGWFMLPAIFLLTREVLGLRIALLATLFAAVASWGVIPARFGLRYPLAPCAVAWTMYFLVRGLRRNERNAMLAAGICVGIGLQGYTAYRFMPVVFVLLVLFGMAWQYGQRGWAAAGRVATNTALAGGMAVLVLMPLLRYGYERPDALLYRATSRLTGQERPIDGDVAAILLDNLKDVLLFFNYTFDVVPVVNLPGQPAMDSVLGALLVVGAAATLALGVKARDPWPVALLGAGVLMLFPSALSIAYPGENPSIVRTGGALPLLMIVCAVGPGMLLEQARLVGRSVVLRFAGVLVGVLALVVVGINTDRVFRQYPAQYCSVAVNAGDIARELRHFMAEGNARENAWIVGSPHWVDYRAVAIWLGDISFANEVFGADELATLELEGAPGWFALSLYDSESLQLLREKYPQGSAQVISGHFCPGEKFVVFTTR